MRLLDRILQKWRMSKALRYIPVNSRLLDIGCLGGEFFELASKRLRGGMGIDPLLPPPKKFTQDIVLIKGRFPKDIPYETEKFDVITAFAVFEHIPNEMLRDFITACFALLNNNGRVIMTVPSPFVDVILAVLTKLRLMDGMSLDEHHGLPIGNISDLFTQNSFLLLKHSKFQLGLNNLFVFKKPQNP